MKAVFSNIDELENFKNVNKVYLNEIREKLGLSGENNGRKSERDLIDVYRWIAYDLFAELFVDGTNQEKMILGYFLNSANFFLGALMRSWHTLEAHIEYPVLILLSELLCFNSGERYILAKETAYIKKCVQPYIGNKNYELEQNKCIDCYTDRWQCFFDSLSNTNKDKLDASWITDIDKGIEERLYLPSLAVEKQPAMFKQYAFLEKSVDVYTEDKKTYTMITDNNYRRRCFISVRDCKWIKRYMRLGEAGGEGGNFVLPFNFGFLKREKTEKKHSYAANVDFFEYIKYQDDFIKRYYGTKNSEELIDLFWEDNVFEGATFNKFINGLDFLSDSSKVLDIYKQCEKTGLKYMSYLTNNSNFYWRERYNSSTAFAENDENIFGAYARYLFKRPEIAIRNKKGEQYIFPTFLHFEWAIQNDWAAFEKYGLNNGVSSSGEKQSEFLRRVKEYKKKYSLFYMDLPISFWAYLDHLLGSEDEIDDTRLLINPDACDVSIIGLLTNTDNYDEFIIKLTEKISYIEKVFFCMLFEEERKDEFKERIENILEWEVIANNDCNYSFEQKLDLTKLAACKDFLNHTILHPYNHKK